jgi:hypothetical protein
MSEKINRLNKQEQDRNNKTELDNIREAGMCVCAGAQGTGKTYQTMHTIKAYIKDKIDIKVKGRKVLIYDTNGEYTQNQFERNNIPNFQVKSIAIRDVGAWSRSNLSECRRIDAKDLGIKEKKEHVKYILKECRNCLVVLEDINTYILQVSFMEDIVGGLVNLRHRALDVIVSYQSLRAVEPRMFQNARWIRLNYQTTGIGALKKIEDKIPYLSLLYIALLLVKKQYESGNKRFHCYIHSFDQKIKGNFSRKDFYDACLMYCRLHKNEIKEHMVLYDFDNEKEALEDLAKNYFDKFFGNSIK